MIYGSQVEPKTHVALRYSNGSELQCTVYVRADLGGRGGSRRSKIQTN